MKLIPAIQGWSELHPEKKRKERPTLTENGRTVLKALQIMGYHWITKNYKAEVGCTIRAHTTMPVKDCNAGYWDAVGSQTNVKYNFLFLSCADEEPTNIDWLLGNECV